MVCPAIRFVHAAAAVVAPVPPFAIVTAEDSLEGAREPSQIKMCDFGSAGNTWDKAIRYRVWLPKTLHVMTTPYVPYNIDPNKE